MSQALSVFQLVSRIKQTLDENPELNQIQCIGEISNLSKSKAGHWYFSLKDDKAVIDCVMFYSQTLRISVPINDGDEVLVQGSVSVYVGGGRVQLVISQMSLNGQGVLYKKYLELRDKLHKMGYFDASHKKKIPDYPENIGVIVGAQSAAQADILKTLKTRWPLAKVKVYESLVQGQQAPKQLVERLKEADEQNHDVLILARGGGSLEDLWAFNDIELVMSIFEAKTPIITGVGHEIDITLVDYVADLRGLTPTDAAIKATPSQVEVGQKIDALKKQLSFLMNQHYKQSKSNLDNLVNHSVLKRPELLWVEVDARLREVKMKLDQYQYRFDVSLMNFDQLQQRLLNSGQKITKQMNHDISLIKQSLLNKMHNRLQQTKMEHQLCSQQIELKSPLAILDRGYILSIQNDHIIRSIYEINELEPLYLMYKDGKIEARIESRGKNDDI